MARTETKKEKIAGEFGISGSRGAHTFEIVIDHGRLNRDRFNPGLVCGFRVHECWLKL
jgi:hypothetical protein